MKKESLRKTIHLLGVLAVPLSMFVSHELLVFLTIVLCLSYPVAEYFRFKGKKIPFITPFVEACAREKELKSWVLTPFYLFLSFTIILIFFDRISAYVGIIAGTLGDVAAGLFGRKFGKHKLIKNKTLEGSLSFFLCALIPSLTLTNYLTAIMAIAFAALIEILSGDFDNFTVPLAAALVVSYL